MTSTDRRLRILQVEDNEGDAVLVDEYVTEAGEGQFVLRRAKKLSTGLEMLASFAPQVVLLDLNLGDSKGIDTLNSFCKATDQPGMPRPPIIVLTSLDDRETAELATQGCAQNYLVKTEVNARLHLRTTRMATQRHGKAEVDKMLKDPTKAEVDPNNALNILQRVNLTAPGEMGHADTKMPDGKKGGGALEHFVTGSKAMEVIATSHNSRITALERWRQEQTIKDAESKLLLKQIEKLIIGNGKGPLAARLDILERLLLHKAEENSRRNSHTSGGHRRMILVVIVIGWVCSIATWILSSSLHPK